ncbi:MAG: hypothetical protein ABIK92_11320 [Pseudomonadota bacterium]
MALVLINEMKKLILFIIIIVPIYSFLGCSKETKSRNLDELVLYIVQKANENDTKYFEKYLDESYKGQSSKLIGMIKKSEMLSNYKKHFSETLQNTANLNYHYLKKGCHFQIDLIKNNDGWKINRIWFCR